MAMNFPDSPVVGDIFGPYEWDGEKWVTIGTGGGGEGGGGDGGEYLPLAGGTMTGPTIHTYDARLQLSDFGNQLHTMLHFGDETTGIWGGVDWVKIGAEGMHVATFAKDYVAFNFPLQLPAGDPTLPNHATHKAYVDAAVAAGGGGGATGDYLPLTGGTLTGELQVTGVSPTMALNRTDVTFHNMIQGWLNGLAQWDVRIGSTADSRFSIWRHDSSGVSVAPVIEFDLATGLGTVAADPSALLGIATKQYVDAIAMAGGSFVDAPVDGQQYARQDANWSVIAGGGGASVIVSETIPVGAPANALWWNSEEGQLYINYGDVDSTQFVQAVKTSGGGASAGGDFLPLAGGTLTGKLSLIAGINNGIALDFGMPGDGFMQNYPGEIMVWLGNTARFKFDGGGLYLPSGMPVDPSHAASKEYVDAMTGADGGAGDYYLPIGGGSITGNLSVAGLIDNFGNIRISKATPTLILDRPDAATNNIIEARRDGAPEWRVVLGDNINYDFYIEKFGSNGAGVSDGKILHIEASAGWVTLSTVLQAQAGIQTTNLTVSEGVWLARDPTQPLEAATKQYVDAQVAAGGGGATGDYLPLTGGALTGQLCLQPDGSAEAPALAINGFPTGLYGASNYLGASVNGVQRMLLTANNLELYVPKLSLYDAGSAASVALGFGAGNSTGLWGSSSELHIASGGINRMTFDDLEGVLILEEPTLARHPATKQYVDAVAAGGGAASLPLPFAFHGKPAVQALANMVMAVPVSIAVGFAGLVGYASTPPSIPSNFAVYTIIAGVRTSAGVITFNVDGTVVPSGAPLTLNAGDVLQLEAPYGDGSNPLADVSITFLATPL